MAGVFPRRCDRAGTLASQPLCHAGTLRANCASKGLGVIPWTVAQRQYACQITVRVTDSPVRHTYRGADLSFDSETGQLGGYPRAQYAGR
jgi:hypothetical protein